MCGRFTLTMDPEQLREAMPWLEIPSGFAPRYNIAPTQPIAVVPNLAVKENEKPRLDFFVWGLIPYWAKDPTIGSRMINARAETLAEKPSFKNAFRRRRCLVLADGFYEWKKDEQEGKSVKIPTYIRLKSGDPFAFAGLWELWNAPDGSQVYSATIITSEPNDFMRTIHNRMPVILPEERYGDWLNPDEADPASLQHLLTPYPAELMSGYAVSRQVNSPSNDSPALVVPAD